MEEERMVPCKKCSATVTLHGEDVVTCHQCGATYTDDDYPINPDWTPNAAAAVRETGYIMIGIIVVILAFILFV